MCQLCSIAITGCDTCDDATICITCLNPTYIKDGGICKPCNLYQPYCLNCTEISPGPPKDVTCQVCMSYYGLTTSNFCALCSSMIPGCQLCLQETQCTKCLNGYFINQTSGKCIICSVAINNCAICDNSTYCNLCYSDSYLNSINSACICNNGLYPSSGFCSVPGCTSAIRFTTSTVCLACSTVNSFHLVGSDCSCMTGYKMNNNSCIVDCGDGLVFNENCDDGNVISGDGCTSTCQV
jgi:cysteine-rich repeat protein